MKELETERLLLRPFTMRDIGEFYEYSRNPNVGPHAGWAPHRSKWESRKILRKLIREDDSWAIVIKETGALIGSVGLHFDGKRANHKVRMLGYVLSEPYWGNGFATEAARAALRFAFEDKRLEMVSVQHFAYNAGSRRVVEKCCFTYEGTLRMAGILPNGKPVDHVCYSMTRADYRENCENGWVRKETECEMKGINL